MNMFNARQAVTDTADHLVPKDYVLACIHDNYVIYDCNLGHCYNWGEAVNSCDRLNGTKYHPNDSNNGVERDQWFVVHKMYYGRLTP